MEGTATFHIETPHAHRVRFLAPRVRVTHFPTPWDDNFDNYGFALELASNGMVTVLLDCGNVTRIESHRLTFLQPKGIRA